MYIFFAERAPTLFKGKYVGPGSNWAHGLNRPMGPTGSRDQLGQWFQMGAKFNWASGPHITNIIMEASLVLM